MVNNTINRENEEENSNDIFDPLELLPAHLVANTLYDSNMPIPTNFNIPHSTSAFAAKRIKKTHHNPTVTKARKLEDWQKWFKAIQAELKNLEGKQTYEVVNFKDIPKENISSSKLD